MCLIDALNDDFFVIFRGKSTKNSRHKLSKSLLFFARVTTCEHSVERRLPLVSAVPISGTKELASRTTNIAWRTRSDTFVLFPLLELTLAVAQHHAGFVLKITFANGKPRIITVSQTVPIWFWNYTCSRKKFELLQRAQQSFNAVKTVKRRRAGTLPYGNDD